MKQGIVLSVLQLRDMRRAERKREGGIGLVQVLDGVVVWKEALSDAHCGFNADFARHEDGSCRSCDFASMSHRKDLNVCVPEACCLADGIVRRMKG